MTPWRTILDRFGPPIVVLLLTFGFAGSTASWLNHNDLPDGFQNEFIHLFTLTEAYFRARSGDLAGAWPVLVDEYYPPLPHLLAGATLALSGGSKDAAVLSSVPYLFVLLLSTAALARALGGTFAGLLAPAALVFSPAIFGNLRRYEPNIAVTALVAASLSLLAVRGGLRDRRTAVLAGTLAAGALLSDRLGGILFFAPVAAALWVTDLRDWRADRRIAKPTSAAALLAAPAEGPERLVRWVFLGLPALTLCGYYYVRWFLLHWSEVWTQREQEITASGELVGPFARFSPRDLFYYPLSALDGGLGIALCLLLGAGLVGWFRVRRDVPEGPRRVVEAWAWGGLLILTLIGKKQPYYAIPALPALWAMAAVGLPNLVRGRALAAVLAVAAVLAIHQHRFLTSGSGLWPSPGRWAAVAGGPVLRHGFLGERYTMAAPPQELKLELRRVAALCEREARGTGRDSIVLFSEGQAAYEGQVMPTLRLLADHRDVEGLLMGPPAFGAHLGTASCFLYITAADRAWPTAESIAETLDQFGQSHPDASILGDFLAREARALPLADWRTTAGEHVYVYGLGI